MKKVITHKEIQSRCGAIAQRLVKGASFYGVPRGGIAPAYMLAMFADGSIADRPEKADYIVDDLIDSGATRDRYAAKFPTIPFITLFDKKDSADWLVFPWEISDMGR